MTHTLEMRWDLRWNLNLSYLHYAGLQEHQTSEADGNHQYIDPPIPRYSNGRTDGRTDGRTGELNKDYERMMVDTMLMIVQNVNSLLTVVTPTAVIWLEFTWIYMNVHEFTCFYLTLPINTWIKLNLLEFSWTEMNLHDVTWIYPHDPKGEGYVQFFHISQILVIRK